MLRRAFVFLLGPGLLAGCTSQGDYYPAPGYGGPTALGQPGGPGGPGQRGGPIAILLPLSGPRAEIGQPMLQAAQLALAAPGSPPLLQQDTAGTPQGAAAAAQAAIGQGAGLILGPLTSAETGAVAPVARSGNVEVLAFTNDPAQAQPGVWTLGITPAQQVRRLMAAAQAQGRTQAAALLPDTDFGHAMAQALLQATGTFNLSQPDIQFHAPGMASLNAGVRAISDYANRRGPIDAKIKQARALGTTEGRQQAQDLAKSAIPPPPFNILLLADTGESLAELAALLPYYDVDRSAVQVIGPALWASPASGSSQLQGAWYAAPDPAARAAFEQEFTGKYGNPPPPLADLAFDAASIGRVVAGSRGYTVAALAQPAGFVGADGWLGLLPDGQVRRGLAVFRIERGGPAIVEPAPQSASGAGV